jgi:hypothetical protein
MLFAWPPGPRLEIFCEEDSCVVTEHGEGRVGLDFTRTADADRRVSAAARGQTERGPGDGLQQSLVPDSRVVRLGDQVSGLHRGRNRARILQRQR